MKPFARTILMLSALLSACSPINLLNASVREQGLTVVKGIPYEPGPRRTLDVYRADNFAGTLPVAVFFYGGSWQTGSKNDYLFVAGELARRGVIVAVADYRLYPEVTYPEFLKDGAAAVAFMHKAAAAWGGDPNRVFVVGHSAGAYIAAMLALDPAWLAGAGDSRDALAGVVGISGPYDFLPIREADIRAVFDGYAESPLSQPINYADGRNPPMLLLHGEADDTVYLRNTTALARRVEANGGQVVVKTYPGVGHIGAVLGFAPWFRGKSSVLDDTASFIANTPARTTRAGAPSHPS